jgi:hypothetical protein
MTELKTVSSFEEEREFQRMEARINPDHYKVGGIETINYMKAKSTHEEFTGHLRLTAFKYLSRAGHKDDALQEYKKAQWYIGKLVEELEGNK